MDADVDLVRGRQAAHVHDTSHVHECFQGRLTLMNAVHGCLRGSGGVSFDMCWWHGLCAESFSVCHACKHSSIQTRHTSENNTLRNALQVFVEYALNDGLEDSLLNNPRVKVYERLVRRILSSGAGPALVLLQVRPGWPFTHVFNFTCQ